MRHFRKQQKLREESQENDQMVEEELLLVETALKKNAFDLLSLHDELGKLCNDNKSQ